MAKLSLTVKYHDIAINTTAKAQTAILGIANTVNTGVPNPTQLISGDANNAITLGSDNKLLVNDDTDYLAYYLLNRGNL